jgi:hypothetical protein
LFLFFNCFSIWISFSYLVCLVFGFSGATPTGNFGATPSHLRVGATPLEIKQDRLKTEYEQRNRDLSDAELDALLPATGYEVKPSLFLRFLVGIVLT